MTLRNKVVGVLYHDNRFFQSVFRKEDLEILGYFAAQAAIAMENAQAYDFLQQTVKKQKEEKQYFEEQYLESLNFEDIIGKSRAICQVFSQVYPPRATATRTSPTPSSAIVTPVCHGLAPE